MGRVIQNWLPEGKQGAVCFSIDDIHPGKSSDAYEAGGDCEEGALRHLLWLQEQHPQLKTTLFITADWMQIHPYPTRKFLAAIPHLRNHFYLAATHKKSAMRLSRHPRFVEFLKSLSRTELAMHGLHHCHRGLPISVEFQNESQSEISKSIAEMVEIFREAGINPSSGFCPPGWGTPRNLLHVLPKYGLKYIAASRDLDSPVNPFATTNGSGLKGVSLLHPEFVEGGLLHLNSNFSATSSMERAESIIDAGGLLSIKAHIVKKVAGRSFLDGLDENYQNYLHRVFSRLEKKYAESLLWLSMEEVSQMVHNKLACSSNNENSH